MDNITMSENLEASNQKRIIDEDIISRAEIDNAFNSLGIKTVSTSEIVQRTNSVKDVTNVSVNSSLEEKQRKLITLTDADRNLAVSEELIPIKYKDAKFDVDAIKYNLTKQFSKNKTVRIVNFSEYTKICSQILTNIRLGELPNSSYIIGAPNGFGKTSFAMECIMLMKKQGWVTVPYRSLEEISIIRTREEKTMSEALLLENAYGVYNHRHGVFLNQNDLKEYKETKELPGHLKPIIPALPYYDWVDYINAKCLITFFSGVTSKNIESRMLQQLLTVRSAKGLPTIVLISTSLQPYTMDIKLKEEVWDEIMSYDDSKEDYDRVKHISCFKRKIDYIVSNNESNVDPNTGIVNN